jgi:hypothetical protein
MPYQPTKESEDWIEQLSLRLGSIWTDAQDGIRMTKVITALDDKYGLRTKIAGEDGVQDILEQIVGRIAHAFGSMSNIGGKRILDIASGSHASRAPSSLYINTPFSERKLDLTPNGYTALFEPWFCRILVELGADPVGVDLGDLEGEAFEHYRLDLGQFGALDFLPNHSFDAVHDSRLFGSPEFTVQFPDPSGKRRLAAEIWGQEQRVLKIGGLVIHSDAKELLGR